MSETPRFFSRARLRGDTPDLKALANLATADRYREHRLVWRLFPNQPEAERDFLYRRETAPTLTYYLLSQRPPEDTSGLWEIDTRAYAPQLATDDRLEFSLRANPVSRGKKTRSVEQEAAYLAQREAAGKPIPKDTRARKRDDIMKKTVQHLQNTFGPAWKEQFSRVELANEAGKSWLEAQGRRLGFAIEEVAVGSYTYDSFKTGAGQSVEVGTMEFTGQLRVTDPAEFIKALNNGIGPAKAFGCGLLLIRRIG